MQYFIMVFLSVFSLLDIPLSAATRQYQFSNEPLDVVIPSTDKDLDTLELCIAGIKANCSQIRRIIVVSSRPLTDQAEWFNEASFPFSKEDVELNLLQDAKFDPQQLVEVKSRVGWYYQQLLKYYAPFVIPDISSNVLILDSDTIFLNPVEFLDSHFAGLYNPGIECLQVYFKHANRFVPGLSRPYLKLSGISHHMVFQRDVLQDLFSQVETHHNQPLWQAFCRCVDPQDDLRLSLASEYEIYFNFVFSRTDQVHIRRLKWANVSDYTGLKRFKSRGYHFVSCHAYLRASTVKSREEVFTKIYKDAVWGGNADGEGGSGGGSTLEATAVYRRYLQDFFLDHDIHSVVDIGCGDWSFSRAMNWEGIHYIGYDIVNSVILKNQAKYTAPNIHFVHGDALYIDLPKADLLICKDVLQHLSNEDITTFIKKLKKFKYCLITNDVNPRTLTGRNRQISTGSERTLDLTRPPFSLEGVKVLNFVSGPGAKQVFLYIPK